MEVVFIDHPLRVCPENQLFQQYFTCIFICIFVRLDLIQNSHLHLIEFDSIQFPFIQILIAILHPVYYFNSNSIGINEAFSIQFRIEHNPSMYTQNTSFLKELHHSLECITLPITTLPGMWMRTCTHTHPHIQEICDAISGHNLQTCLRVAVRLVHLVANLTLLPDNFTVFTF